MKEVIWASAKSVLNIISVYLHINMFMFTYIYMFTYKSKSKLKHTGEEKEKIKKLKSSTVFIYNKKCQRTTIIWSQ